MEARLIRSTTSESLKTIEDPAMKKLNIYTLITLLFVCSLSTDANAQIAINKDGSAADPSASLDISSTTSGFLMPRLTYAQRTALTLDGTNSGLLVYQTNSASGTVPGFFMNDNGSWVNVSKPQTASANINLLFSSIINGSLPGATLSFPDIGEMRVDLAMNADDVILVTPELLPIANAPVPPLDYCTVEHTGACSANGGHYQSKEVIVASPSGTIAAFMNDYWSFNYATTNTMAHLLWHTPLACGGSCETLTGDYQFLPENNTIAQGPSCGFYAPDLYTDNVSAFVAANSVISSIDAGTSADICITGNELGSPLYQSAASAFIDWNSDGDFYDSVDGISENVVSTGLQTWPFAGSASTAGYTNGVNVFPVSVPTNSVTGPTTLRVMNTRFANNQTPCMSDTQGSTHDYVFNISNGIVAARPGENRTCNVFDQDNTGFEIRCYDDNGSPVNTKIYLQINPN